jgi:hypothetical protein
MKTFLKTPLKSPQGDSSTKVCFEDCPLEGTLGV